MKRKNLIITAVVVFIAILLSAVALAKLTPKEASRDISLTIAQGPPPAKIDRPAGKRGGPPGKMRQHPGQKGQGKEEALMMSLMTKEQIEKFEKWLKINDPDKYREIQDLKLARPELYLRVVSEGIRHMSFLEMMKKKDPKIYARLMSEMKLDGKMIKLAKEFRESKDEKRKKEIKSELTQTLNQIFDIRSKNRAREVNEMSKKIEELKQMLKKRKDNKKLIVEKKLKELTGQMEGLEW
ncbi:MAG: hypothetical protein K8T10_10835 [Candidatus Eremiobacteraeota bacterium]|nr:hypothetical protein [Candidatus Eremiobacteraeota bacterium]